MNRPWPHGTASDCTPELVNEIVGATEPGDHLLLFVHPETFTQPWLDRLVARLPRDCKVYGMSVAGAVGSGRLADRGISWLVLPGEQVALAATHTRTPESADDWRALADRLLEQEQALAREYPDRHGATVLFATGRDRNEEHMASRLYMLFPALPLVGGSAGTTVGRNDTFVVSGERVFADDHLILLVRSAVPLDVFQHHHYVPRGETVVVTGCGSSSRVVTELDGRPARDVLAELLGCAPCELSVERCSEYPFGLRLREQWYIRSVMDVAENGALQFACEIQEGTVLSVMRPTDLVGSLQRFLPRAPVHAGLLFHCLGRYFEARRTGKVSELGKKLEKLPAAGGNTFGEQYMGLHLNHTLTGLWFREQQDD